MDQQADMTHSETLISKEEETGTCVWGQRTTYFNNRSPSDWISCALLQLLENQECCSEKRSLDIHKTFC